MADLVEARPAANRWRATPALIAAILAACLLWFFGRGLMAGDLFAYRDGAHYHFPLFTYVNERWSQGELPLWNPADNLGQPLAGDPTAAVFYPVRLLAAILPIGAVRQYQVYVILHVAGAMASAFWLARKWRASVVAAGAGALTYALSGVVLFQYCNVIFLVGAAWWPLALAAIEWLRKEGSWLATMSLAAVLAMMTLGGDAQAAYLVLALAAWRFWWSADEQDAATIAAATEESPLPASAGIPMSRVLVTTAILASSLAAVQIFPSLAALAESGRAESDRPRSVYEVPAYLMQSDPKATPPTWEGVGQGLFGRPTADTHGEQLYSFSVAPWRVLEAAIPNALGRELPENHRWAAAIADEGALWSPSLYFGILPLVIAIGSMRLWGGAIRAHWLTWIFLVGLIASFGWYGAGWLTASLGLDMDPTIGPQSGGLYWLFTVALPGFVHFRYPAKLLTPAMLALAMLAARSWQFSFRRSDLLANRLGLVAAIGGGVLAIVIVARLAWDAGFGANQPQLAALFGNLNAPTNPLLGPLDRAGGWWDLALGLMQMAAITGGTALALRSDLGGYRIYAPIAALVITSLDLAIANGWLIQYGPAANESPSPIVKAIAAKPPDHSFAPRLYRAANDGWWPTAWQKQSSAERLADNVAWESATLRPKYHLLHKLGQMESSGPWSRRDYELALHVARSADPHQRMPENFAAMLGVDWILERPSGEAVQEPARSIAVAVKGGEEDVVLKPIAARRAWIAEKVKSLPALTDASHAAILTRTREVFLDEGKLRDLATTMVEGPETLEALPEKRPAGESCRVVKAFEEQIDLEIELQEPGLVVLADSFDSGWSALVSEAGTGALHETAILRVNRVLRGVMLPAGKHRVSFVYQSPAITIALWISAIAWIFWLTWMEVARRRAAERGTSAEDEAANQEEDLEPEPTKPSPRGKAEGRGKKRK